MALNIKNPHVEDLAEQIARLTGESKTEAIRKALLERLARLRFRITPSSRRVRALGFLEREVWPRVPADQLGHPPVRAERERILGYQEERE
jgi:antitoxin VapB